MAEEKMTLSGRDCTGPVIMLLMGFLSQHYTAGSFYKVE